MSRQPLAFCLWALALAGVFSRVAPAQPTTLPAASQPAPVRPAAAAPTTQPAGEGASLNLPPGQPLPPPTTQKLEQMSFAVVTLDGKSLRVPEDFRGKLVLVVFWSTACPHCRAELPVWRDAQEKFGEHGVEIVGLLQDANQGGTDEAAAQFIRTERITWPNVYVDAPELGAEYGVTTIPTSFVVDGDSGKLLAGRGSLRKERLTQTLVALAARKKIERARAAQAAASQPGQPAMPSRDGPNNPSSRPAASQPSSRPAAGP